MEKANSDYSEFKKLQREITSCTFALESSRRNLLEINEAKEKVKVKEGIGGKGVATETVNQKKWRR